MLLASSDRVSFGSPFDGVSYGKSTFSDSSRKENLTAAEEEMRLGSRRPKGESVWDKPDTPKLGRKGSRRHRRYLNLKYLQDIQHVLEADTEEIGLVEERDTVFAQLLDAPESYRAWRHFAKRPESEQRAMISQWDGIRRSADKHRHHKRGTALTAQDCYVRIERRIRHLLRTTHVPMRALEAIESEVLRHIADGGETDRETGLCVAIESPYLRCLAHGLGQYYGLVTASHTSKAGECQVHIDWPTKMIGFPPVPLSAFLQR